MHNISNLQVGDRVGAKYITSGFSSSAYDRLMLGVVSKINRWGHMEITFHGMNTAIVFDKYGTEKSERKSRNYWYLLEAERVEKMMQENTAQRHVNTLYQEVLTSLQGLKNGYGDVVGKMSKADVQKMQELISLLHKEA